MIDKFEALIDANLMSEVAQGAQIIVDKWNEMSLFCSVSGAIMSHKNHFLQMEARHETML